MRILEPFLVGFGAVLFLQERAAGAVDEMIEAGRLAPEEGRRFLEDFSERLDRESREFRDRLGEAAQNSLRGSGLATRRDLDQLRLRLAKTENRLADLEERRVPIQTSH